MERVETRTIVGQSTYFNAAVATRRTDASSGLASRNRLLLTHEPTCSKVRCHGRRQAILTCHPYPVGSSYWWSLLLDLGSFRMPWFQPAAKSAGRMPTLFHLGANLMSVAWEPYPIRSSPGRYRLHIRAELDAGHCSGRVACRIRPKWTQSGRIIGRHDRASPEPPVALPQWGRSACSDGMDQGP